MQRLVAYLVAVGAVIFVGKLWSQNDRKCGPDQFYSSFSSECETATLQAGVGSQINSFGIADLRAKFNEIELVIDKNPAYEMDGTVNHVRKYKGIRLRDFIAVLLPAGDHVEDYVLATTCLDGFNPILDSNVLRQLGKVDVLLAYEQIDIKDAKAGLSEDGKWELVTTEWGTQSPAPFYLVWNQSEGTYPQAWPFQLNSMRLIKAQDYQNMLDRLKPGSQFLGKKPVTDIEDGYNQFTGKCIICHEINGIGGQKAKVDLKVLFQSFQTTESARSFLETIVKNPPAGMSEIKGMKLTDEDVQHLAAYLRHMSLPLQR